MLYHMFYFLVCDDIHAAADNPSQQVKILFNALLHCTDDGALQMFLDAVNAVEGKCQCLVT